MTGRAPTSSERHALRSLRVAMIFEAVAYVAPLGFAPFEAGRWLPLALGAAGAALLLAWFVGQRTTSTLAMTAGFQALLVALGLAGLRAGHPLPGSAVALVVLVGLLLPASRAVFAEPVRVTTPATAPPRAAAAVPPPPPPGSWPGMQRLPSQPPAPPLPPPPPLAPPGLQVHH